MKQIVGWTYPILLIVGGFLGLFGLSRGSADMAGIGNAMFLAGALTPTIMLRKFSKKDAAIGAVWTSTVVYFGISGTLNGNILMVAAPILLVISIVLTKYSGVKLGRQAI